MKVVSVLIVVSIAAAAVDAFAPSRSILNARQATQIGVFGGMFEAKEGKDTKPIDATGGDTNAARTKFDGILKKHQKKILMISSTAKDGVKGERENRSFAFRLTPCAPIVTIHSQLHRHVVPKRKSCLMRRVPGTQVRMSEIPSIIPPVQN